MKNKTVNSVTDKALNVLYFIITASTVGGCILLG
jgi:hypothetical protein